MFIFVPFVVCRNQLVAALALVHDVVGIAPLDAKVARLPAVFAIHTQLLMVSSASMKAMNASATQINCPSAGVGLSSSSIVLAP
jgi:hypothetical protein